MPGPYPIATLSVTIDSNGITAPVFEDILLSLQASYTQIYGSDVDLDPDTQDGAWIAVQAQAIYDNNQALIAGYFSYSPTTAQGIGLSSVIKINGLLRLAPSNSTVEVLLIGQAGTVINNGIVSDVFGNAWNLPASVVIPLAGDITVTATAAVAGATLAAPNTVTTIQTLVPGWQSVTNPQSASPGNPLETDATLRKRQSVSTGLPAITPRDSLAGAVANVPGVGRSKVYDNDTDIYDIDGVPPHSVAVVTEGGNAATIAQTIMNSKNTGCGTYGNIQVAVTDQEGVPQIVNFFALQLVSVYVTIQLQPLTGFLDTTNSLIAGAVAAFINGLDIGENVFVPWLYAPANLAGDEATGTSGLTQAALDQLSSTYVVRQILIGTTANPTDADDVIIPFNAAATADPAATVAVTLGGTAP
jgi:uncharacterized phage protein gp47/JayE